MEFEEHEVSSRTDQKTEESQSPPPDDNNGQGSAKVKRNQPNEHHQAEKKLQIKDKAAKNFADGDLERGKILNISEIKNKIRRNEEWVKLKRQKKKEKKARQEERKKEREALGDDAPAKLVPKTIESMREYDETTVGGNEGTEEDEEVEHDIVSDEFASYFTKSYVPKVLITCSDNPHSKTIAFVKELSRIIPNSEPKWRSKASIKKMVKDAVKLEYTDIVIINEDNRHPNGLVVTHLPEGPKEIGRAHV